MNIEPIMSVHGISDAKVLREKAQVFSDYGVLTRNQTMKHHCISINFHFLHKHILSESENKNDLKGIL